MSTPWFVLPSAVSFRVSGKDARRYLHNRLSQDIRDLAVGQGKLAAALSAQGRVEVLFTVFCEAEEAFLVVSDGGSAQTLEDALKRFVVADRVVVQDISQQVVLVHLAICESEVRQERCVVSGCEPLYAVPRARVGNVGVDLLFPVECSQLVVSSLSERFGSSVDTESLDRLRWAAGCVVFPDEVNEQGMILEFGLREAVSFSKGCYVGQEVVERSDAIGKQPRQLERIVIAGSGLIGVDSSVMNLEGGVIGKVVRSFVDPVNDRTLAFALLRTGKYNVGDPIVCMERQGVIVKPQREEA